MANQFIAAFTAIWNSGATKYYGVKLNVTDSASDADSRLIEVQTNSIVRASIRKDGAAFVNRLYAGDGTTALPGVAFESDLDLGLSRIAANTMGFNANSAEVMRMTTTNLRMATGTTGIQFNGDTLAANALNDYEEGTFTPILTDGTNNATMHASNGGFYTKIGRLVTLNARVQTTALGAVAGSIKLTGLPFPAFNSGSNQASFLAGFGSGLAVPSGQVIGGHLINNTTEIILSIWDTTAGTSALSAAQWSATGQIRFSLAYIA